MDRNLNDRKNFAVKPSLPLMKWTSRAATILALLSLPTGCLCVGGSQQTKFNEVERIAVKFPSARAAQDFHDGLEQSDRKAFTETHGFVVPLLFARGGELYHETVHYNAEVRLADVDRDGEITEAEAQEYVEYVEQRNAR